MLQSKWIIWASWIKRFSKDSFSLSLNHYSLFPSSFFFFKISILSEILKILLRLATRGSQKLPVDLGSAACCCLRGRVQLCASEVSSGLLEWSRSIGQFFLFEKSSSKLSASSHSQDWWGIPKSCHRACAWGSPRLFWLSLFSGNESSFLVTVRSIPYVGHFHPSNSRGRPWKENIPSRTGIEHTLIQCFSPQAESRWCNVAQLLAYKRGILGGIFRMCCLFVIADHALIDTVHDLDPNGVCTLTLTNEAGEIYIGI